MKNYTEDKIQYYIRNVGQRPGSMVTAYIIAGMSEPI